MTPSRASQMRPPLGFRSLAPTLESIILEHRLNVVGESMELLITVLTLGAAIYALVPRARQLDLQLRLGLLEWAIAILASTCVLYLQFNDFFSARGLVFHRQWPTGITPQNSIYIVLIGAAVFLATRVRFTRLSRGKIKKFRKLIEELYWAGSYGELFTLLQDHVVGLFRISRSEFVWSRLREKLRPFGWEMLTQADLDRVRDEITRLDQQPAKDRGLHTRGLEIWNSIKLGMRRAAFNLLPEYDAAQRDAQELANTILLSPRLVQALVRTRPYLGLDIIREWEGAFDFVSLYLKELLRDHTSVLFQEIAKNQNINLTHRYILPESNPILHFLFSDAKHAKDLRVYKPVGDYAIAYLDELARNSGDDPYNWALGDFQESGAWSSSLFIAIRFFDIMVQEALHQGIEWHMWLYYMPPIVERIVRNYRLDDPLADPDSEWPIRYNLLLWEIFSCLRNWIESIEDLPLDQANVKLKSTRADHENGNIPKSSILALCECTRCVLESDNLTERTKRDLTNWVINLYFDLRSHSQLEGHAAVLRQALSQGGTYRRRHDEKYRHTLMMIFQKERGEYFIKNPEEYLLELEQALQ